MDLIVVIDKNYGIGCAGGLLYRLPGDLKYFKEKTLNKTVIMGRKTLQSLPGGRPLPGRVNVVLTRSGSFSAEGVTVARGMDELKSFADNAFVIGGAEVYSLLLPYCNKAYITRVDAAADADAFFPRFDNTGNWRLISESENFTENGLNYRFQVYENGLPKSFF